MSEYGVQAWAVRVAVIADIHGNDLALAAVLQAAEAEGVEAVWCLGDVVAHGPRPAEVVARLRAMGDVLCVRGNTDRYVLTGDLSGMIPPIDRPTDADECRVLGDARESFAWTRGCLVGSRDIDWLAELPVEQRVTLPDGTRVLLVHAAPGRDDGLGLQLAHTDSELAAAGFVPQQADLVLVGHTHVPGERHVQGCHIFNPGPVSLPRSTDDRARWAVLEATAAAYTIEHRETAYDLAHVVRDLTLQRHPAARWLTSKMTRSLEP
jgi:predicted phosphodiesterase